MAKFGLNNEASNKLEVGLSSGKKIQFQLIHAPEPPIWAGNKDGTKEEYYVLQEGGAEPNLVHVTAWSPLAIKQVDIKSGTGAELWKRVQDYLSESASRLEPGGASGVLAEGGSCGSAADKAKCVSSPGRPLEPS